MEKFSIKEVGVKVGLEIHQQLVLRKNYFVIVLLSNQMSTQSNFKENYERLKVN